MASFPTYADAISHRLVAGAESLKSWLSPHGSASFQASRPFRFPVLPEAQFLAGLRMERQRLERSGRPFLLLQVSSPVLFPGDTRSARRSARVIASAVRLTDTVGWIQANRVLGIICTEIGGNVQPDRLAIARLAIARLAILDKVSASIAVLSPDAAKSVRLAAEIHSSPRP
jgi:hypothetical protein